MWLRVAQSRLTGTTILKLVNKELRFYQYAAYQSILARTCHQQMRYCSNGEEISQKQNSWVHLLYSDENNADLQILRRKLGVALTSTRSQEKGDLLPYLIAQEFVQFYDSQQSLIEKATFFENVAEKLGVDFDSLLANIEKSNDMLKNDRCKYGFLRLLLFNSKPSYNYLFHDISKLQSGTRFLVNMREDLLSCFRQKYLAKTPSLKHFDSCFKEHLAKWFANGFLDLEEVSWNKSSGHLLEKVKRYEAVHVIKNWDDLKLRASQGRRVFIFSHKLMPDEPLVILHTLLGNEIPVNINNVLGTPIQDESLSSISTATFYSVTSTQRGLDGIGLGNLLIKRVVEKLKNEFSDLSNFITLSPIPGFRKWLDVLFLSVKNSGEIHTHIEEIFENGKSDFLKLEEYLMIPNWHEDMNIVERLQQPMTKLCAAYLCKTKRRGFASNPVAHFHLRNGACLWKINWLGNTNNYGIKSSYGFMVNYKYELNDLEDNNDQYVQLGKIAVSSDIEKLLELP